MISLSRWHVGSQWCLRTLFLWEMPVFYRIVSAPMSFRLLMIGTRCLTAINLAGSPEN